MKKVSQKFFGMKKFPADSEARRVMFSK